jgi:hypothetical protein
MANATFGDWAATAGALFTAVAAVAAWRSARQGRHLIDATGRPLLEPQVLADSGTGMLTVAIVNAGQGLARGSNYAVHALGHSTDGVIGNGFVPGGTGVNVRTQIGPLPMPDGVMRADLPDLGVMVVARDAAGFALYRTHDGRQYTPKTRFLRRPRYPDRVDVFRNLFPEIDLDAAVRVASVVEPPEHLGA